MRLTGVSLYSSSLEEPLNFGLSYNEPQGQYIVREMVGLDAAEIVPKFYGSGLQSRDKFYDFALRSREIVLRVVLRPRFNLQETYSDVRDRLYRTVSSTRLGIVELHFKVGATIVAKIEGFITKFEVPYFTELPEAQMTFRCDDPMFRAVTPVEFETGELSETNPVIIPDSISTAPHGFTMSQTFTSASASYLIQDQPTSPDWTFTVTPSGGFLTGDTIYFCSEYSNKQLYMIRGGTTIHLMDKISPNSIWPIIFPGSNTFQFVTLPNLNWDYLNYYAAYWGV